MKKHGAFVAVPWVALDDDGFLACFAPQGHGPAPAWVTNNVEMSLSTVEALESHLPSRSEAIYGVDALYTALLDECDGNATEAVQRIIQLIRSAELADATRRAAQGLCVDLVEKGLFDYFKVNRGSRENDYVRAAVPLSPIHISDISLADQMNLHSCRLRGVRFHQWAFLNHEIILEC